MTGTGAYCAWYTSPHLQWHVARQLKLYHQLGTSYRLNGDDTCLMKGAGSPVVSLVVWSYGLGGEQRPPHRTDWTAFAAYMCKRDTSIQIDACRFPMSPAQGMRFWQAASRVCQVMVIAAAVLQRARNRCDTLAAGCWPHAHANPCMQNAWSICL